MPIVETIQFTRREALKAEDVLIRTYNTSQEHKERIILWDLIRKIRQAKRRIYTREKLQAALNKLPKNPLGECQA